MVNRSDRDPPSLNDRPSFELSGEMRRGSANSIRARRLRPAKQAGYKPAASSVAHHTQEPLHIGRRPYNDHESLAVGEEQIAVLIHIPHVPKRRPTRMHRVAGRRRLRLVIVIVKIEAAFEIDAPLFAGRKL